MVTILAGAYARADANSQPSTDNSIAWRSNYRAALEEAQAAGGMALLWFVDPAGEPENESRQRELLSRCLADPRESRFTPVRLPTDATLPATEETTAIRLLDHPAFAEMFGHPGIAIIDMRDECSPHFHHVVSVYPFVRGSISEQSLTALLDLPAGSLTQRTLVWAVRTQSDQPASTSGELSPLLMEEAASHSRHQAAICRQGHHCWEERFHKINERLPADLVAQEICAESWPGQGLLAAAQECVHSWRQSSGHWNAVRTRHPLFGYDMQRGANGIWYAAGVFGRNR
ncbi:MAG TPA: hypothetical protein VMP01_05380 [Pirellulaceae bacterium]|nr:hypothetical protein [Pirellulaceae bacterium]